MPSGSFQLIPVLIGISILTFLMLYLVPGDPMQSFAGDKPLTEERAAVLRHQLGLDRPLWVQYLDYASHAVRGDLGRQLRNQRPVLDSILEVLPGTVRLTAALTVAVLTGVAAGVIAALAHGTWLDTAAMAFAIFGVWMPVFYSSLLIIWLFSFTLGWLPATGQGGIEWAPTGSGATSSRAYCGADASLLRSAWSRWGSRLVQASPSASPPAPTAAAPTA